MVSGLSLALTLQNLIKCERCAFHCLPPGALSPVARNGKWGKWETGKV